MNSVQLQIVLKDMYKLEYGILSRTDIKSPLGSVFLSNAENINNGHLLVDELRTYCDHDIKQTFGIDVLTFLDLPLDVIDDMLLVASERKSKKSETLSEVEKILDPE